MKAIRIEVDEQLKSFLPKYLENRKKDLAILKSAYLNSDFDQIKKICHGIKGHAASYGFTLLTDICGQAERAAANKQAEQVNKLLQQYEEYINNVELP